MEEGGYSASYVFLAVTATVCLSVIQPFVSPSSIFPGLCHCVSRLDFLIFRRLLGLLTSAFCNYLLPVMMNLTIFVSIIWDVKKKAGGKSRVMKREAEMVLEITFGEYTVVRQNEGWWKVT